MGSLSRLNTRGLKLCLTAALLGVALTVALVRWLEQGLVVARAASFTVNTTADENDGSCSDGDCSLRDAVILANGNGITDTITLGPGTYVLSITGPVENATLSGDLDISDSLTIEGAGPDQTFIDADRIDRVFDILPGAGRVIISGVTIQNGDASYSRGGGIYNPNAVLALVNSVISNCVGGDYGGGVYVGGSATLSGVQIISNAAAFHGGGLAVFGRATLSGGEISDNSASDYGGGVYVGSASAVFTQTGSSTITLNTATNGGGIFVDTGSAVLNGGQILNNYAAYGGGVYVSVGTLTQTGESAIAYNTATWGGGVYVDDGSTALNGGQIISNTATGFGGGVYVGYNNVTLNGVQIRGNSSSSDGGGVYVDQGSVTLSGGEIRSNSAITSGGGVFLNAGDATMSGGLIISNSAFRGGGVFAQEGSATLSGGQIVSNSASWGGGAYVFRSNANFNLTGVSTVALNFASENGGGVYVYSGTATLFSGQIISNSARKGGGVVVDKDGAAFNMSGGRVSGNSASDSGAGVYVWYGSIILNGGQIADNTADKWGGGVGVHSGGDATVGGGQVRGNSAGWGGGGVFVWHGFVLVNGGQIVDNSAPDGGGLFVYSDRAWLDGGQIISNSATSRGGAVYVYESSAVFTQTGVSTISLNVAGDLGGGVYVYSGTATLNGGRIISNSASDGGGLYLGNDGTLTVTDSCIANNADTGVSRNGGVLVATGNWWGASDGPSGVGTGGGDSVGANVDYAGYKTSAPDGCLTLRSDLAVEKTAYPSAITPGAAVSYRLAFTNTGPHTARYVVISDSIPVSVTGSSVLSSGADIKPRDDSRYVWDVADLVSGTGGVITITGVLSDAVPLGPFSNTVSIRAVTPDGNGANNEDVASITIGAAQCTDALAGVTLLGATQGFSGTAYAYAAIITPTGASLPITYTWEPAPLAGQGTAVATYAWAVPGTFALNVSAANCGATVRDSRSVAIRALPEPATGDAYEEDDACEQATNIPRDGSSQIHNFHDRGDNDWVAFTTTLGITYVIEVRVPPTSTADVEVALYDTCGGSGTEQDPAFSRDIRLVFRAPSDGRFLLQLANDEPAVYGTQAAYHLLVREVRPASPSGALAIVAGRLEENDALQTNIHNVTNAVYRLARDNGCSPEQIHYLATDLELDADGDEQPDVDALATRQALETAITGWVSSTIGPEQPFTLFMVDHGGYDAFYLDGTQGEVITPTALVGWLDALNPSGAEVNVIVEACHSGSFIDEAQSVSRDGRMVMASTGPYALAYATQEGASFSDAFLNALDQATSLLTAFEEGRWAVAQTHPDQTPWMDADGDGTPNEAEDVATATGRVFACAAAGPDEAIWPPQIEQVEVIGFEEGQGEIWAQVKDDSGVQMVWAVVYGPSYEPTPGEVLAAEPVPVTLRSRGEGWYSGRCAGFDEGGAYRVVVHAQDDDGLEARPKEHVYEVRLRVYLPLLLRRYPVDAPQG